MSHPAKGEIPRPGATADATSSATAAPAATAARSSTSSKRSLVNGEHGDKNLIVRRMLVSIKDSGVIGSNCQSRMFGIDASVLTWLRLCEMRDVNAG